MKKKKVMGLIAIASLVGLILFGAIGVFAENSGKVQVTYTKSESEKYPLQVKVKGDGEVCYEADVLRNQQKQYFLTVDESMKFSLNPDNGQKVESLELNGENILDKVVDNHITINGLEKAQVLIVKFNSNTKFLPQTGDSTGRYLSILGICLIVFLFIIKGFQSAYVKKSI